MIIIFVYCRVSTNVILGKNHTYAFTNNKQQINHGNQEKHLSGNDHEPIIEPGKLATIAKYLESLHTDSFRVYKNIFRYKKVRYNNFMKQTDLEESIVNATYHKSYEIREPIEIRIYQVILRLRWSLLVRNTSSLSKLVKYHLGILPI